MSKAAKNTNVVTGSISNSELKGATLLVLNNIHACMELIKNFSFSHLYAIDTNELAEDEWVAFNDKIDLKMYDDEGVIHISAYPVVNGNTVTSEFVKVGALPTFPLDFDPLEHFGLVDVADLSPKQIAVTNVIEHIIGEIESFKDLSTPKDLVAAAELYEIYLSLSHKKVTH